MVIEVNPEALVSQNAELVAAARQHYDDEVLVYHAFELHIISRVWPTARRLAAASQKNGHTIDLPVLDAACLYHDALEHKPLGSRYKTKERRAGALARREVLTLGLGYSEAQAEQVRRDVISTSKGIRPTTKEGALLKRADNYNVGQPVVYFLENSVRIIHEQINLGVLKPDPASLESWKEAACEILTANTDSCDPGIPGFEIPEIDTEVGGNFIQRSKANIEYLAAQTGEALLKRVFRKD